MFLRITRASFDPAKAEQAISLAQDTLNASKKRPGFQHAYRASDPQRGQAVFVSIWDTKEHAQFERPTDSDIASRSQAAGVKLEAPEIYEVNAQG